jgi:aminoglycoside phosphotransferase (APT) family kinase protein
MLEQYTVLHHITKGFSEDQKYVVQDGNAKVVIRLFEGNQERRDFEFQILRKLEQLGAKTLRAISIEEGKMVTSFIEGSDAEDVIETLSEEEQYAIGWEASQDLLKIHSIVAEENTWYDYQLAKYKRYVKQYQELPMKVAGDDQIIRFIEERIPLMKDRPSVLQHDDFHLSNLIVHKGKYAGAIDFGRFDWGDPIFDFIKLGMFSAEQCVPFAVGMIGGYHNGKPPQSFWELYALYLAMSVFSAIVWGHRQGNEEVMLRHIERFSRDHEGFTKSVPAWYKA